MISYEEENYITLYDITFEVNGVLYTTKRSFEHSILCADITMDDLVKLEEE